MDGLATMGIDGSSNVQDLEEYLQDEIFVDYFNTFFITTGKNYIIILNRYYILVHRIKCSFL